MRESYVETKNHWPAEEAPEDLLAYFESEQLSDYPDEIIRIYNRERFLELLDKDAYFEEFWIHIQEIYPKKAEYFASLKDEQMPYDGCWIEQKYSRYFYEDKLNELSEDERAKLQSQFDKIRSDAYEAALRGEAIRLDCAVSEVRPECPVLALTFEGDQPSKLADLPDAVFLRIMKLLDTLDVFRVTLVCKKWRSLIYNHPRALTRAEHAKTTHLITFTEWMNSSKIPCCSAFDERYQQLSWGLIRWCYRITAHLETVIVDHEISYKDAANLIQSCPNLKNLQIGYGNGPFFISHRHFKHDVMLPNLEFYCFRTVDSYHDPGCEWNLDDDDSDLEDDDSSEDMDLDNDDSGYKLDMDAKVLLSCESLRYFGASVVLTEIPAIDVRDRMQHAFGKLVALELHEYSFDVLEALADVDHLQLKYLGLEVLAPYCRPDIDNDMAVRMRTLLGRILSKLRTLEILKVNGTPGIGSSTIKLMTDLKLNLKTAFFLESLVYLRHFMTDDLDERDYWEPQVLTDFAQMLMSNDPELDLSEFYLVVTGDEYPRDLPGLNLGFTFTDWKDYHKLATYEVGLNFQSIKRRLGIDF